MAAVLVDTSVFVAHLHGAERLRPGEDVVSYSAITRAELFAGLRTDQHVGTLRTLLAPFREIPVDREIAERAGQLRRDHALAFVDALMAATALAHSLTLITHDLHRFAGVRGLRCRRHSCTVSGSAGAPRTD